MAVGISRAFTDVITALADTMKATITTLQEAVTSETPRFATGFAHPAKMSSSSTSILASLQGRKSVSSQPTPTVAETIITPVAASSYSLSSTSGRLFGTPLASRNNFNEEDYQSYRAAYRAAESASMQPRATAASTSNNSSLFAANSANVVPISAATNKTSNVDKPSVLTLVQPAKN